MKTRTTGVLAAAALVIAAVSVGGVHASPDLSAPLTEPGDLFGGGTYALVFEPAPGSDDFTYVLCTDEDEAAALLERFPYLLDRLVYAGDIDVCMPVFLWFFRGLEPRLTTDLISGSAEG